MKIVILSETDSGKSTLAGHFLYECNREVVQIEDDNHSKYASAFSRSAKRDQIDINLSIPSIEFRMNNSNLILIDSPSNRDYTEGLIKSISVANCAFIVIAASSGEFECALSRTSHMRHQISLAQSSSIEHLIILVNKMDKTLPAYSQDRFVEIKTEMLKLLNKIQYEPKTLVFIPVSAWFGDNLTKISDHMPWFQETTIQSTLLKLLSIY